jgi:hypothetical protein
LSEFQIFRVFAWSEEIAPFDVPGIADSTLIITPISINSSNENYIPQKEPSEIKQLSQNIQTIHRLLEKLCQQLMPGNIYKQKKSILRKRFHHIRFQSWEIGPRNSEV